MWLCVVVIGCFSVRSRKAATVPALLDEHCHQQPEYAGYDC